MSFTTAILAPADAGNKLNYDVAIGHASLVCRHIGFMLFAIFIQDPADNHSIDLCIISNTGVRATPDTSVISLIGSYFLIVCVLQ